MQRKQWLWLDHLGQWQDVTLLLLRVLTGAFLVHEVLDNITSAERMAEFASFMDAFGFPQPEVLAPLSVWLQLGMGLLLIAGLLTRWTGLVLAGHFAVAVIMVHWQEDFRGWWPAIVLVGLGLHFMAAGSGRFGLDHWLSKRGS